MGLDKNKVDDWMGSINTAKNSMAKIMFTVEEIDLNLLKYSVPDITYAVSCLSAPIFSLTQSEDIPDEIILICASILIKIYPYVRSDDSFRHNVFVQASKLIPNFLKSTKKTKIMVDLMNTYQKKVDK